MGRLNQGKGRQCVITAAASTVPDCIYWTLYRNRDGYGMVRLSNKLDYAHRVVYELAHGPIPTGLHVLHTCNNGHLGCVNPNHLKVGTHQENMDDRDKAGRHVAGNRHRLSKLSNETVVTILSNIGYTTAHALATQIGVSVLCIRSVVYGENWKRVSIPFYQSHPELTPHPSWTRRHGHNLTQGIK